MTTPNVSEIPPAQAQALAALEPTIPLAAAVDASVAPPAVAPPAVVPAVAALRREVIPTFDELRIIVAPSQSQAELTLAMAKSLVITPERLEFANGVLLTTKKVIEATKEHQSMVSGPARAALANIETLFRITIRTWEETEKTLKKRLADYKDKVDAERLAQAMAGEQVTQAPVELGGTTFIKKWVFEVTDENIVARNLCVPDPTKIRAFIAAGGRESPGLRIFEDTQVRASRKGAKP